MDFDTFREKVIKMYWERIEQGQNSESACFFGCQDFPDLDVQLFAKYAHELDNCGYVRNVYLRNFSLSAKAIDEIGKY